MVRVYVAAVSSAPRRDAEVEVDEDELDGGDVEGVVGAGPELLVDVAGGRGPRGADAVEGDAAALGEPLADVVPVVVEGQALAVGGDDREDMAVGALQDAFEDGDVGDLAAGGEGLAAGEDEVVAVLGDHDVLVARVDGPAEEPAVPGGLGLHVLPLFAGADQAGGPVPEVVVAEELADGPVGLGDLADDPVGGGPVLACRRRAPRGRAG